MLPKLPTFVRVLGLPVLIVVACANPAPAPPTEGVDPTFAVGPTFAETPAPDNGQAVFTARGCTACHTIEGISNSRVGPDLTHIATNAGTRKPPLTAEEYIRESIEEPGAFVAEGYQPLMPSLAGDMTDDELDALVAFLLARE